MNKSKFEQQLKRKWKTAQLNLPLHFFEVTTSTNDLAKERVTPSPAHGSIFIARRQIAGRGTYNRSFFSGMGGIYCSLLINVNEWHFEDKDFATFFTAVAVRNAVYDILKIELELKWVNDFFLQGRKIGGILTERQFGSNWLVIGIGLNVSNQLEDFPEILRTTVGTLGIQDSDDYIKASLIVSIIEHMLKKGELSCKNKMMMKYKESLFILNQQVKINYGGELFQACVLDVDSLGRLVVQKACGNVLYLQAGEVKLNT